MAAMHMQESTHASSCNGKQQTITHINRKDIKSEDKYFKNRLLVYLFYFTLGVFQNIKRKIKLELTFESHPKDYFY